MNARCRRDEPRRRSRRDRDATAPPPDTSAGAARKSGCPAELPPAVKPAESAVGGTAPQSQPTRRRREDDGSRSPRPFPPPAQPGPRVPGLEVCVQRIPVLIRPGSRGPRPVEAAARRCELRTTEPPAPSWRQWMISGAARRIAGQVLAIRTSRRSDDGERRRDPRVAKLPSSKTGIQTESRSRRVRG